MAGINRHGSRAVRQRRKNQLTVIAIGKRDETSIRVAGSISDATKASAATIKDLAKYNFPK
jgi:hypothetical protein